jgi:hypothetical protein
MEEQLNKLIAETEAENTKANEQIARWTEASLRTEGALMVLNALRQLVPTESGERATW